MENFVKRLIVEHKELTERRNRLNDFINSTNSNEVSKKELLLLGAQLVTMDSYINILENRLFVHDIQAEEGLYKKLITEEDIIEDVEFDDRPVPQPAPNPDGGIQSKK